MLTYLSEALLTGIAAGTSSAVFFHILRYEWPVNSLSHFFAQFEDRSWAKPLWFCIACNAGQLGLWFYIILKNIKPFDPLFTDFHFKNTVISIIFHGLAWLMGIVISVCFSILTAAALSPILKRFKESE